VLWLTLDRDLDPQGTSASIRALGLRHWVYLGEDSAWRVQASRGQLANVERLSITRLLDEVSQQLRRPYIDWIGSLAKDNDCCEKPIYPFIFAHLFSQNWQKIN
jgi:hypothetical protein